MDTLAQVHSMHYAGNIGSDCTTKYHKYHMCLPSYPHQSLSLMRRASARISSMGTVNIAHVIINEVVIKSIFELHYGTLTGAPRELDTDAAGRAQGTEGL